LGEIKLLATQPKVFVSSTIHYLINEREAAYRAIEKSGAYPIMSEKTIPAQNSDSLTTCNNKVKESDIFILILGGTYGWQPNGKESITELEFLTAKELGITIIAFNTNYEKDDLQKEFTKRVESIYFRKTVSNAYELESEIEKSLKEEIEKKQSEYFNKKELVYSNLVKIKFPQYVYIANLNINKNEIEIYNENRGKYFKKNPSLFDYLISALHMKNIHFPGDWVLDGKKIITFHDLADQTIPLTHIIDKDSVEKLSCDSFYSSSMDKMSVFKYLLKNCLETKLFKMDIRWIKEGGLFAFIPKNKDLKDRWLTRTISWKKENKQSTRTVVDVRMKYHNENEVKNLKCLAFRTKFENLDDQWFLSINPDWVFLSPDFRVCRYEFKYIQYLKKMERNLNVFNHFVFILHFLQPSIPTLFSEYSEYKFLTIGEIEKFEFAPIIPDNIWKKSEEKNNLDKLCDSNEDIGLFEI
jgi:hypothetical protein